MRGSFALSAPLEDGVKICHLLDALDTRSVDCVPIYPSVLPKEEISIVL